MQEKDPKKQDEAGKKRFENVDRFEFTMSFDSSSGVKQCALNISAAKFSSSNSWTIEDDDMESMVKMVNIMSSKYSQIR